VALLLAQGAVLLPVCSGARSEHDEHDPSGFDVPEDFRERNFLGRENHLRVLVLRYLVAGHCFD
jgi:hypothetical protein